VIIDVGVQFVNPQYISIGDGSWIDKYVVLLAGPPTVGERKMTHKQNELFHHNEGDLVIGSQVHIAAHVLINGHGGVYVGDKSTAAAGSRIVSLSHHYRNLDDATDMFPYRFSSMAPQSEQALISGPIVMEENTALATNAVMLPGSSIGRNSWVGVGSLVVGSIPAGCIAVGVPAKRIKDRADA
jgi:acetyltransferase-like isoleucine patch superfamily enzyme